ncbi:type VI secretion protein IcmF/TssM N-terminal domain-containing protein [Succinimonas sp.]|uniref:type VI secretion protein IcmF/TssM N-terminal domain-containing protein n=1 Tax=Succinimonas sp. TaxID=1936151 RepID=UPI0038648574
MDNINAVSADVSQEGGDFFTSLFGTPLGILVFILLLVISAFVIYVIIRKIRRRRALNEEKRSLKDDLMIWSNLSRMVSGDKDATQGKQQLSASYEIIKLVFKTAQDYIRTHCLKKQRAPWYVVVGEPLSGKTALFRDGDLNTVSLRQEQDPNNTEPLHFHVHRDRVFLDVRGNVFFDNWMGGSSAEWYAICELIHRTHAVKPLSGIILTIPADALIADSESITDKKAALIFSETLRLARTVRMILPIRIVITKADCILGFREFFAGIAPSVRTRMSGIDLSELRHNSGRYSDSVFTEAWDGYIAALRKTALGLMISKKALDASYAARGRIDLSSYVFAFPEQANALKENLRRYLRVIFDPDSAVLPGMPEGVFFCSSCDQGICFSAAFAELKKAKTDEAPLTGRHDSLTAAVFRNDLMGRTLGDLDRVAVFTRKEIIRRHVPALTLCVVMGLISLIYLAGALLGNRLITRNLEADTQYYRQLSALFKEHAPLNSPLLDMDKTTGKGADRFDSIMVGMPGVTRFNFFASSKITLLADRPLPLLYTPANYLLYDYNNLYHEERKTLYNQLVSDMILFPATTSFVHNLRNDDSYFTEARADALLACMHLSISDSDNHAGEKSTDVMQECLERIVRYMYPRVSQKVAHELSDFASGSESYAKNTVRQILIHKDFYPGINAGIRNLVKQLVEVNAYPESDYQMFRAVVKHGSDLNRSLDALRDFAQKETKSGVRSAFQEYQDVRQEVFRAINTSDYLSANYRNFLMSFAVPPLSDYAGKDSKKAKGKDDGGKDGGGKNTDEALNLARAAFFEKSYHDYQKILDDDFAEFSDYVNASPDIGRHIDHSYTDKGSLGHFRDLARDSLDKDYQTVKSGLTDILASKIFSINTANTSDIPLNYRDLADMLRIIYVKDEDLPIALNHPEYFEKQLRDLRSIFKLKGNHLKTFLEAHKDLEATAKLGDAARNFLDYEEAAALIALANNLLEFYPEDGSLAGTVASVARDITADGDILKEYIDSDSAARTLGSFNLDAEYAPRAVSILVNPAAALLEYSEQAKQNKSKKKDPGAAGKDNDSGKAIRMFSGYVDSDPRVRKMQRMVTRYADAFVSYWSSFAENLKPAFHDYESFHEFAKRSRAYEINAGLRDVYSMSYDVLSEIRDAVLSGSGAANKDHALKQLSARMKLLDLNYNQACSTTLNSWSLLPDDPLKANRYLNTLSKKTVRKDYTILMSQLGADNTLPWWDAFVRQGIQLLKAEANYNVTASLAEFQNRLYYFPVLRNGNVSGQVIVPEDMAKLRKTLRSFGIINAAEKKEADKDAPEAQAAADEGVDSLQEPLMSGLSAERNDVTKWAQHADFILKTFGDTENPVTVKIAIPDIKTQNALLSGVYGQDGKANAALKFRYLDIQAGKDAAKRYSSIVTDTAEKVIYEGRADADGLAFRFFRFSDDAGAEAEITIRGRYAPLRLYLDNNLVRVKKDADKDKDDQKESPASYVPLTVKSKDGEDCVIFVKVYFSQKMLAPEDWPSQENWPLLSSYQ